MNLALKPKSNYLQNKLRGHLLYPLDKKCELWEEKNVRSQNFKFFNGTPEK
jgi:hypothetical protein